jgi:hypothetical protein
MKRPRKKYVPPRPYDLLTEMVTFGYKAERNVPLLKLEDLLRDKTATTAVSMH